MSSATQTNDQATEEPDRSSVCVLMEPGDAVQAPPFFVSLHESYITGLAATMETSVEGAWTEHLRMSGVYWSLTALSLLRPWPDVNRLMHVSRPESDNNNSDDGDNSSFLLDWIFTCFDEATGGFGGNSYQDGHLLYTLSAVQILALCHALDDPRFQTKRERVIEFVVQLQQPDGSWAGDRWGELDTRFIYCALSTLSQLQALDRVPSLSKSVDYLLTCQNMDGGFGCVPGAESHAGQVFCCIAALSIAQSLHLLQKEGVELLAWWLSERQVDSGGLNGRPEKQADVCYSWWILSALSILGKVSWINGNKLAAFILKCQDDQDGGIADRPDDMVDVFHTYFGIAGLSLLGHLHQPNTSNAFRKIDPIYALPIDVCQRLQLPGQVVPPSDEPLDARLEKYSLCKFDKR